MPKLDRKSRKVVSTPIKVASAPIKVGKKKYISLVYQKNPRRFTMIACAGLLGLFMAPKVIYTALDFNKVIDRAIADNQLLLEVANNARKAEQIYESGCLFVVSEENRQKFTTFQVDRPVYDGARPDVPLPIGTAVCAWDGTVGVVGNGWFEGKSTPVVVKTWFTGNRDVIEKSFQKSKMSGREFIAITAN